MSDRQPTIATLARRPFARHVFECRRCSRGLFRASPGQWSRERLSARQVERCAHGAALWADVRVANHPALAPRVRASWEPFRLHQRECEDCRLAQDLDSRFGGVSSLCRKGEMLFVAASTAVHQLAASLGPVISGPWPGSGAERDAIIGVELPPDLAALRREDDDDPLVDELPAPTKRAASR